MKRHKLTVVALITIAVLMFITMKLALGTDPEGGPLLGNWEGKFDSQLPGPFKDGGTFVGYLQLYRLRSKFKLELGNREQTWEAEGSWDHKGTQIILNITSLNLDTTAGEGATKKNGTPVAMISGDEVRSAYGKQLVLGLSDDQKRLDGLPMSIGPLSGVHRFKKSEGSSYIRK